MEPSVPSSNSLPRLFVPASLVVGLPPPEQPDAAPVARAVAVSAFSIGQEPARPVSKNHHDPKDVAAMPGIARSTPADVAAPASREDAGCGFWSKRFGISAPLAPS